MLKQIIELWKGETFMSKVVNEFGEMLTDAEYVFTNAWKGVTGQVNAEELKESLYKKDKDVNTHERQIRRMIAEHLSINPKQDTSGCLIMMSLVKDAERIGDYAKNIFELEVILKGSINDMKYAARLSSVYDKIVSRFSNLKIAFIDSNEELAKKIMEDYTLVKDECNQILNALFSEELSTKEAVSTALLSRYLKRINSHMSNIASGIVYPLDKIDFVRVKGGLLE